MIAIRITASKIRGLLVALAISIHAPLTLAAGVSSVVTSKGLHPTRFGMTVAQFSDALNEPMIEPENPDERGCFYLNSIQWKDVYFMFEQGRLHRIDIRNKEISTRDGIRVGQKISYLKRRYGAKLLDQPHHYSGPEDRYLTLYTSHDTAVRFETSNGKVDNFYVGHKNHIELVEGCL